MYLYDVNSTIVYLHTFSVCCMVDDMGYVVNNGIEERSFVYCLVWIFV